MASSIIAAIHVSAKYQILKSGNSEVELPDFAQGQQPRRYIGSAVDESSSESLPLTTVDTPTDAGLENSSRSTRIYCTLGLVLTWAIGIIAIVVGTTVLRQPKFESHLMFTVAYEGHTELVSHICLLLSNVLVTALLDVTGFIHVVSLKWALQREGRLTFNANLRLLTSARSSPPNRWYCNIIMIVCSVWAYSSVSFIFNSYAFFQSEQMEFTAEPTIYVRPDAFTWLGISLLGTAAVTTWALVSIPRTQTWSSHPLDMVLSSFAQGNLRRTEERCMASVHDSKQQCEPSPLAPCLRQESAWAAHDEVCLVGIGIWSLVALGLLSGIAMVAVHGAGYHAGDTYCEIHWALVPDYGNSTDPPYCPVVEVDFYMIDSMSSLGLQILAQSAFQGIVTLSLHCAELLVNLSRDEATWRQASSPRGCRLVGYNSILAACRSWQNMVLFVLKPLVHWVFGLAILTTDGIRIWAAQLIYLSLLLGILGLFATYLINQRPSGPQPAAFGHLQTLADLIDEWYPTMYWGHKAGSPGEICHAGMCSSRPPPVHMDQLYQGRMGSCGRTRVIKQRSMSRPCKDAL